MTQEQIDDAIGVSKKEIFYFSWNPGLEVYQVYAPSSKVNRTMMHQVTLVWSDFKELIGKMSTPDDGLILEFDVVMTKINN